MSVFGWLKGTRRSRPNPLAEWKAAWSDAIEGAGTSETELRRQLDALAPKAVDVELELEMLEALGALRAAQQIVAAGSLPTVETGHRIIGAETCHFSAPASLASDHAQTTGRVLFTGTKAVFVGSGRTAAHPWHTVHAVARIERDLLLTRPDGSASAHFRFNSFADAVVSSYLARQLKRSRGQRL